jgi:hypothetical protein
MANVKRLVELSMVPPLAKEVASQIDGAVSGNAAVAALTPLADPATATTTEIATKVNEIIAALQG